MSVVLAAMRNPPTTERTLAPRSMAATPAGRPRAAWTTEALVWSITGGATVPNNSMSGTRPPANADRAASVARVTAS